MELVSALLVKMTDHPLLSRVGSSNALRQKANELVRFFSRKYSDLRLRSYGRDLSRDLFTAWTIYIDSEPDLTDMGRPEHILLLPELSDGAYGPFVRWLQTTDNDENSVIVLHAALHDRVAKFLRDERLELSRKEKLRLWHRTLCKYSSDPQVRLQRAVRDLFINQHYQDLCLHDPQRMGSAVHFLIWHGFGDDRDVYIMKATTQDKLSWLRDYVRAYRDLDAKYDEAFAAGRHEANELLMGCYAQANLVYGNPKAYIKDGEIVTV